MFWRDWPVCKWEIEMSESRIQVKYVSGYPSEGQQYKLYAMTKEGPYTKIIAKKEDMVHSSDYIDIKSGEWTKAPY